MKLHQLKLTRTTAILAGFITLSAFTFDAGAQFFYDESCKADTGKFTLYGQKGDDSSYPAYYTGTGAGLKDGKYPTYNPGEGWLRLTDYAGSLKGWVLLEETFPSTMGVTMEFDFAVWGPADDLSNLADGFCVFLYDGSKPFSIGTGDGGTLGYTDTGGAGLKTAYLGIGIDEYGNFSTGKYNTGGPGFRPSSIAISNAKYEYEGGTMDSLKNSPLAGTSLGYITADITNRPSESDYYRRIRIDIEPIASDTMKVTVKLKKSPEPDAEFIPVLVDTVGQPTPPLLKMGFAGVTGGEAAYHEVRNVIVRTPGEVYVTKSAECTGTKDQVTIQTIVGNNTKDDCENITVYDTLPANFVLDDEPFILPADGGSFVGTPTHTTIDGRLAYSYTLNVNKRTPLFVTFNGHFSTLPANGQYVSNVEIKLQPGFPDDSNPNNNRFTFTGKLGIISAEDEKTDILLNPGGSTKLNATVTNIGDVTSVHVWKQSTDDGKTWTQVGTSLASTSTPSYTYTGTAEVLISCLATWTFDEWKFNGNFNENFSECENTDSVIFRISSPQACADSAATAPGVPVKIGVLANDRIPHGYTPTLSILPPLPTGMATITGDSVQYTLSANLAGGFVDTLTYSIASGTSAKVYITVSETPDNISDATCYIDPPATNWGIHEVHVNATNQVYNFGPLTAGDIDGNDTVMIIGFLDNHNTAELVSPYLSHGLKTFYFDTELQQIVLRDSIVFAEAGGFPNVSTFGSMAIARYDSMGYIVVPGYDGHLYAYSSKGANLWKRDGNPSGRSSDFYYKTAPSPVTTIVNIADFNHDGIPEVYAGNRIFSLATGNLLCHGGTETEKNTGILYRTGGDASMAADVVPGGNLELCAGTQIYRVDIPQGATAASAECRMSVITDMQLPETEIPSNASHDGATQVVDIDGDGALEIVVVTRKNADTKEPIVVYVWKPLPNGASHLIGSYFPTGTNNYSDYYSIPMIGDIDGDTLPEIVYIGSPTHMYALDYCPDSLLGKQLAFKWEYDITDVSAETGMTLFDFNNDGRAEIVYRDETTLHIIDSEGNAAKQKVSLDHDFSYTLREYPLIVDIDGDGQAEIVVSGDTEQRKYNGFIRVFKSSGSPWAPARRVWNQYAYNATNINDDLTVPRYPINPATLFRGKDSLLYTADDVRPYNNFRQQQTPLSAKGLPLWITPNAVFDDTHLTVSLIGDDSVSISLGIANSGNAALGHPVYVSLYRDSVDPATRLATDSLPGYILPDDTGRLTIGAGGLKSMSFTQLVIRLNDDGGTKYPVEPECDCRDSIRTRINPVLHLSMTKNASLNGVPGDGIYSNPVSMLYRDTILYTITAVNANLKPTGALIIRDTLPAYLYYAKDTWVANPPNDVTFDPPPVSPPGTSLRDTLRWTFTNVPSMDTVRVTFRTTLGEGSSGASQPMFINRAWVTVSDTVRVPTNSTYHQGAGVSTVTFSATAGGSIYNADPQILDFRTTPRSGIIIVPDEGYGFAGWSHDDYTSLRGEPVAACSGIMHYDQLTIYGDVELRADFVAENYPIRYYLHEGKNAPDNPSSYTVTSPAITLAAPHKPGDVFIGWTGVNGDDPQPAAVIPSGSTGPRDYFANYLNSGHESVDNGNILPKDRIWTFADELHVLTDKAAAVIRIYSPEGTLIVVQTAVASGETRIKLHRGIYIVTLNDDVGRKVIIR